MQIVNKYIKRMFPVINHQGNTKHFTTIKCYFLPTRMTVETDNNKC